MEQYITKSVNISKVIEIVIQKGDGTDANPFRVIKEVWDLENNLMCTIDPYVLYQRADE